MNWKNWPYWVIWGVIGGGVALLSATLTSLCEYLIVVPGYSGLGFECMPFAIPWIPFWFIPNFTVLPAISYEVIGITAWFVGGSLLGWVYGKIKNRNKPPDYTL